MNLISQVLIIASLISWKCAANFTLSNVTLPQTMLYHYAAIYNEQFTIFGGEGNTGAPITISQSTSIIDQVTDNPWSLNNVTMPSGISGLYVYSDTNININGNAYIINQWTQGGNSYQQLLFYDLTAHKYAASTLATHRVQNPCIVYNSKNNIIYTIGGFDTFGGAQTKRYTQRFNVFNNTWITDGADTVNAKYLAGCSLDTENDYIYYFGGHNYENSQTLDEIQKYSVSDNQWTVLSETLSTARRALRCRLLSTDSNIYCIGGDTLIGMSGVASNLVDVFDPTMDTIINTIYLNVRRTYFSAILFNSNKCIIVSGGDGNGDGSTYLDSIETFGDCIEPTRNPSGAPSKSSTSDPSTIPTKNPTDTPSTSPGTNQANIHCVPMAIVVICMGVGLLGS